MNELNQELVVSKSAEIIEATHRFVAINATEMAMAKQGIHDFVRVKISSLGLERQEMADALEEALRHKWKTSAYKNAVRRLDNRILYYGKILCACEEGFTIVPNMDVDVFAIRRQEGDSPNWTGDSGESTYSYASASPSIPAEGEQRLSVGEGEYVSPEPTVQTRQRTDKNAEGKTIYRVRHWTTGFEDIDFPLAVANPVVMSATADAMEKRIFDRIGVVPQRGRKTRGDPIVLGQITFKEGNNVKTASFLIAWYLDPRTL